MGANRQAERRRNAIRWPAAGALGLAALPTAVAAQDAEAVSSARGEFTSQVKRSGWVRGADNNPCCHVNHNAARFLNDAIGM